MVPPITRRQLIKAAFFKPWVALISAVYGYFAFGDFVAEKILSPTHLQVWQQYSAVPNWDANTWLTIAVALSFLVLFEGTFRLIRSRETVLSADVTSANTEAMTLKAQLDDREHRRYFLELLEFAAANGSAIAIGGSDGVQLEWVADTQRLLVAGLGIGCSIGFFESTADVPRVFGGEPVLQSDMTTARIEYLRNLIDRFETVALKSSFNPTDWPIVPPQI